MTEWRSRDGFFVVLNSDVVSAFASFRQHRLEDTEAGGVLLGRRRGQHVEVVHATRPYSSDTRKPRSFAREAQGHQQEAEQKWLGSDGFIGYVGEWHTHREDIPTPSPIDIGEWRRLSRSSTMGFPLVAAIIGTFRLCLWRIDGKDRIHALEPVQP